MVEQVVLVMKTPLPNVDHGNIFHVDLSSCGRAAVVVYVYCVCVPLHVKSNDLTSHHITSAEFCVRNNGQNNIPEE